MGCTQAAFLRMKKSSKKEALKNKVITDNLRGGKTNAVRSQSLGGQSVSSTFRALGS